MAVITGGPSPGRRPVVHHSPALNSEDAGSGRLYRFVPTVPGQVEQGSLFAASCAVSPSAMSVGQRVAVTWLPTGTDGPDRSATTSVFDGGEGAWISNGRLLFTTKGDERVWAFDIARGELSIIHDCRASPDAPLSHVDNVTTHPVNDNVYIAEDGGDMQLCVLSERDGVVDVRAALLVVGQDGSEITGPAFSPDGTRLYFSSQRGDDGRGQTFEVVGPFHQDPIEAAAAAMGLQPAVRQASRSSRFDPAAPTAYRVGNTV